MRLKSTPLAALALVATTAFAGPIETNDNAALRYWRAFSMLTETDTETIKTLTTAQIARGDSWLDNEEHAEWLQKRGRTIELLGQSAMMDEADFGIDYDKGINALITHAAPMRASSRLVLLQARADLRAGDAESAIGHIATALRMSEHISGDRLLISSLVSVSMFTSAGDLLREAHESGALQNADLAPIRDALARFDAADPFGVLDSVQAEADIMGGWFHREASALEPMERADMLLRLVEQDPADLDDRGRKILSEFMTDEGLDDQVALYKLFFTQAIAVWNKPDAETRLSELVKGLKEGVFGHLAVHMAPALTRLNRQDAKARAVFDELREIAGG